MKALLLAVALLPVLVFSQTKPCDLLTRADSLYGAEEFEAAQNAYYEAFRSYSNSGDWNCCHLALYSYADVTWDLGQYRAAIDTLERWIPFLRKQPGIDLFLHARLYLAKSFNYAKLPDNQGQLEALENAIDIYDTLDTLHLNVAYACKNAGQILLMRLNYPKAAAYFEKALEMDTVNRYTASVYSFLSDCCYWQEDYDKALYYLEKGFAQRDISPTYTSFLALSGAGIYLKKGNYSLAEQYARQALTLLKKHPEAGIAPGPVYATLAEVLHAQKKWEEAGKYWNLALEATARTYPEKDREHAKMLVNAGDFFAVAGQADKALLLYQRAMVQAFPGFHSEDIGDNPSSGFDFVESWAMTAPARKAGLLVEQFEQTGDVALLANAAQCYDLALRQVGLLKATYGTDAARLYMGGYSKGYFEEAIRVQAMLYAQNGQAAHLERIYQLMEDSKADVLREAVERNRALAGGLLPDSTLRREASLRLSIAELRTRMAQGRPAEGGQADLARLEREYEKILQVIKLLDPRFQGAGNAGARSPLAEIYGRLKAENAILVEYFYGEEDVYVLGVHAGGAFLKVLSDVGALGSTLGRFGSYFQSAEASLSDPAGYFAAAHDLYNLLIPARAMSLIATSKKLVVIPDGPLGYLPFEALLADVYSGSGYGGAPYLIRQLPVQYSWSAELLWRAPAGKGRGGAVQLNPMFAGGERGLAPLGQGAKETGGAGGFRRLEGAAASLAAFRKWGPQAGVLHLSTHARAGAGEEPRVEFFDQPISLSQLYGMLLPADLVVLSACETNLGEIAEGEGIMSLARGFAYAGARSLIAAQWQINESSTAQILAQFYQGLSGDLNSLEALHRAKLGFLDAAPTAAFQSPYYWAGLTFYGQDGPVDIGSRGLPWWVWAAGAAVLIGVGVLFGLLRKSGLRA
jgi:tetratricopeptide (TPR) repeat protein